MGCSNINPIVDSKTIILIAKGAWPVDQFCHSIRRDLKVSDDTTYTMTVDFINVAGKLDSKNTMRGHEGFVFNYWDNNNYDFVYKQVHSTTTGFGSIRNGAISHIGYVPNNPPIQSGIWYNLR